MDVVLHCKDFGERLAGKVERKSTPDAGMLKETMAYMEKNFEMEVLEDETSVLLHKKPGRVAADGKAYAETDARRPLAVFLGNISSCTAERVFTRLRA